MEPDEKKPEPQKVTPSKVPVGWLAAVFSPLILMLIIGMLLPSVRSRESSPWTRRRNAVKQICLAILEYREMHGANPPVCFYDGNGRPSHSWRVLVLPFMDENKLYNDYDFDEPWNSPHNLPLRIRCPDIYRNLNENMETGDDIHSRHLMTIVRSQDLRDLESTSEFLNKQGDNQEIPLIIDLTGTEKFWIEPWDFEFQASSIPPGEPQGRGYMVGSCETSVVTVLSRMDLFKLMIKYENWKSRETADE